MRTRLPDLRVAAPRGAQKNTCEQDQSSRRKAEILPRLVQKQRLALEGRRHPSRKRQHRRLHDAVLPAERHERDRGRRLRLVGFEARRGRVLGQGLEVRGNGRDVGGEVVALLGLREGSDVTDGED